MHLLNFLLKRVVTLKQSTYKTKTKGSAALPVVVCLGTILFEDARL